MKKNLLIFENTNIPLKRNNDYILQGPVAVLDKENRNGRIYTKDEYLRHLDYLRKDLLNGQQLLGECDHPDDRFETKLQNVSHQVLDLWYDPNRNQVMGKIKLLDTPAGKLAKELVDDGVDLYISSRAAGGVNEDKTVNIQQIYTYDLVAKPGFAEAKLHRVNESLNVDSTLKQLNESYSVRQSKNVAKNYGILNEDTTVLEINKPASLRTEVTDGTIYNKKIDIKEMSKPIFEAVVTETAANSSPEQTMGENQPLPEANVDPNIDTELIIEVQPIFTESDIIDVQALYDPEDKIKVEVEDKDSDKEDKDSKSDKDDKVTSESIDDKPQTNQLNELTKKEDVASRKDEILSKLDNVINGLEKKKAVKESIIEQYPFAECLNESDFKSFSKLDEQQKTKVVNYLNENCIINPIDVQATWKNALNETKVEVPKWLELADEEYKKLYELSSDYVKNAIKANAEYLILDTKSQIDSFWENTGILPTKRQQLLNESFINAIPQVGISEKESNNNLPYSNELIKMTGEILSDYNKN